MRLMSAFYGQLLTPNGLKSGGGRGFSPADARSAGGDTDKASALADAQRNLIARGGRYNHPYFWGAFVLVGQMK